MGRLELEEKGYSFVVSEFQCKVRVRIENGPIAGLAHYMDAFFDSWPNPRPLPTVWGLALAEAQRDYVARRLS